MDDTYVGTGRSFIKSHHDENHPTAKEETSNPMSVDALVNYIKHVQVKWNKLGLCDRSLRTKLSLVRDVHHFVAIKFITLFSTLPTRRSSIPQTHSASSYLAGIILFHRRGSSFVSFALLRLQLATPQTMSCIGGTAAGRRLPSPRIWSCRSSIWLTARPGTLRTGSCTVRHRWEP